MINNTPLISIIIPVYNVELYLRECLDSILEQKFDGTFEVILVNDGSTDKSLEICSEYEEKYSNISLISGPNVGVSAARNKALDTATGEWITFVDADDILLPNALSTLYRRFLETHADVILAQAVKLENGILSKPFLDISDNKLPLSALSIKNGALWGYLIKRENITENNIRFINGLAYSEDQVFLYELSLSRNKTIAFSETPVYVYRKRPDSACSNKNPLRRAEHQFMAAFYLREVADKEIDRKSKLRIEQAIYDIIQMGINQYVNLSSSRKALGEFISYYEKYVGKSFNKKVHLLWFYLYYLCRRTVSLYIR